MRKVDVRTPEHALLYLLDCTLATVESMAMQRSRKKGEYERQISIANTGIAWVQSFGISFSPGDRAEDVCSKFNGSVAAWAAQYEPAPTQRKVSP